MLVMFWSRLRCGEWPAVAGPAVVARRLEARFLLAARETRKPRSGVAVAGTILRSATLLDPAGEFVGIEMSVAAVNKRGKRAAREGQLRRISCRRRPRAIPSAD